MTTHNNKISVQFFALVDCFIDEHPGSPLSADWRDLSSSAPLSEYLAAMTQQLSLLSPNERMDLQAVIDLCHFNSEPA